MKQTLSLLGFAGIIGLLTFSGCKKQNHNERLDDIVKDLDQNSYSLSFDKTIPDHGITRTAYGAESYLVYADARDVNLSGPLSQFILKVPVWKILGKPPRPTCYDMVCNPDAFIRISNLLKRADVTQFAGLKEIKIDNGRKLLATSRFTDQYAALQPDSIDAITKDLDASKFILLKAPGDFTAGFTRDFYGSANLNSLDDKSSSTGTAKVFFKRPVIGCFNNEILSIIRERLNTLNPNVYGSLTVTPMELHENVAVLQ